MKEKYAGMMYLSYKRKLIILYAVESIRCSQLCNYTVQALRYYFILAFI